jgi:hypothetical protein
MIDFPVLSPIVCRTSASRVLHWLALCVGLMTLGSATAQWCAAQSAPKIYKTIPTNEKFRDIDISDLSGEDRRNASRKNSESRRARSEAKTKARDGIESGNIDAAKGYLNGYVYPLMTQPEQLTEAGEMRDGFFRTFMRSDLNAQARQQLISSSILPAMETIANGDDYYPAARLNAIAVIGRLDDRGLVRSGGDATPPIPSAAAFTYLSDSLTNPKLPAYLKAAAMQGITRHLKIDRAAQGRILDDTGRDKLTSFAVDTLGGKNPGQDQWKPELDYWLKRRAVQLIGELGRPGPGGNLVDLLLGIVKDQSQTLWMQFDAVKSLRTINFSGLRAEKASEVVLTVTEFLQASLSNEAVRVEKLVDDLVYKNILYGDVDFEVSGSQYEENVGKSGGTNMRMDMDLMASEMEFGGMGMSGSGTKMMEKPAVLVELPTYQLNLLRRRMKILAFTCNDVLVNAQGLPASMGEKEKQLVDAFSKFTQRFMKQSSTGIVNLDEIDTEMKRKESFTTELVEICKSAAGELKNMVATFNGDPAAAPAVAPVADPADPLNGLGGFGN